MMANESAKRSTRRLGLAAAALLIALGTSGVSNAALPTQIIAGPEAFTLGYLTKNPSVPKGGSVVFRNFDLAPHDVVSVSGLFRSAIIGLGKSAPVLRVSSLKRGRYAFYCTIHPNMKGTLTVK
jgi:plastocyanin